jgi:Sec-independent protein translocase protein TatA
MTVEFVLFLALDVGVIALLLLVLNVLLFGAAEKFPNLLRRHGAGSIRLQFDGRRKEYSGSRSNR